MSRQNNLLAPYASEAVGAMIIIAVVLFVAALLQTGRVREWFDPGATIKVVLPQSGLFGLSDGADVEIIGTKAGDVRRIVIDPEQNMHAEIYLSRDMLAFVRRDSQAIIRKRFGVAGDAYLEITRGFGEELNWEFAVLEANADSAPTETMAKVVEEVRTRVLPLIDQVGLAVESVSIFSQQLSDPKGSINSSLANVNGITGDVRAVTRGLQGGQGAVGRLLNDSTIVTQLESLLAQTNDSMSRISPLLDELNTTAQRVSALGANLQSQSEGLPDVTRQARSTLAALEKVLKDLGKTTPQLPRIAQGVADSTDSLPVLLIQTQQTMAELDKLIRQLRANWLLGGQSGGAQPGGSRLSPLEVKP